MRLSASAGLHAHNNVPGSITITPVLVADLLAKGERIPLYVHVIDHPDARVLVDTGITEQHPAVADLDPHLRPLNEQDFDLAGIDIVVNTHLHFDHCGGNHLFVGRPIYVQRGELDDARSHDHCAAYWRISGLDDLSGVRSVHQKSLHRGDYIAGETRLCHVIGAEIAALHAPAIAEPGGAEQRVCDHDRRWHAVRRHQRPDARPGRDPLDRRRRRRGRLLGVGSCARGCSL